MPQHIDANKVYDAKIVHVIDCLGVGGAERVLVDICNLLYEENYQVSVICLLDKAELDDQLHTQIPVTYIRRSQKFNPFFLLKLRKELKNSDIIHIHLRHVLRYVSLLFNVFKLHKKKVIVFHDHYGKINTDRNISSFTKRAIFKCTAYVGVSQQLIDWAASLSLNSEIIKLSNIVRSIKKKAFKKPNLQEESQSVSVISIGNFRPQKNYEFLCQLIAASPNNYNYTIYGAIVDDAYYHKINQLIIELGITDRTTIVTDCENVKDFISEYDLGVHCAKSETGPLVAIEYMSSQVPFIAYDTGEVATQVKADFPNFIKTSFEISVWLESMNQILMKRVDYQTKLETYFNENYSEDDYLNRCIEIYARLMKIKV